MMEEDKQHEVVVPQNADEAATEAVTEQPCAPGGEAPPEEDAEEQRLDDDGGPAVAEAHAADENPADTPRDATPAEADAFLLSAEQPATVAQADAATLQALVEAVVYVLPEPLPAAQIAAALNQPLENVQQALNRLIEETARPERGVFVREVAGGYQAATKPEHHEAIRNFVKNLKQPLKLDYLWASLCILGAVGFLFVNAKSELAPAEDQGVVFGFMKGPQYASIDYLNIYSKQADDIVAKAMPEAETRFLVNGYPSSSGGFIGVGLTPWNERTRTAPARRKAFATVRIGTFRRVAASRAWRRSTRVTASRPRRCSRSRSRISFCAPASPAPPSISAIWSGRSRSSGCAKTEAPIDFATRLITPNSLSSPMSA